MAKVVVFRFFFVLAGLVDILYVHLVEVGVDLVDKLLSCVLVQFMVHIWVGELSVPSQVELFVVEVSMHQHFPNSVSFQVFGLDLDEVLDSF